MPDYPGGKLRKRLCLNLDGTGQAEFTLAADKSGRVPTSKPISNVARLGRATLLDDEDDNFQQIVYYQAGIGAETDRAWFQNKGEEISGVGVVENVREAYGFIANNYDFGDEIYITGFSRGAFTARSVGGLLGKVGILTKKGLDKFYEAFDYYEFPAKHQECPVSETAGETRKFLPGTNPPERIKIRAIGVFDTVGAMGKKAGHYGFHDVTLGEHVEHAFHLLALDEYRGYYRPTLWENKGGKLDYTVLEQCWIVGDHSGVGGSWPDPQSTHVALAWMMDRFSALGVKFNPRYLFDEFLKYKAYVKKNYKGTPFNPRQWAEGRITHADYATTWISGPTPWDGNPYYPRQPMNYHGTIVSTTLFGNPETVKTQDYLKNTNETVHAGVRYRYHCASVDKLGVDDSAAYDKKPLKDWVAPKAQPDGKIGMQPVASKLEVLKWSKPAPKDAAAQEASIMYESKFGDYEKLYLSFYHLDEELKERKNNIWKQVLGEDGPPKILSDAVNLLKTNPAVAGAALGPWRPSSVGTGQATEPNKETAACTGPTTDQKKPVEGGKTPAAEDYTPNLTANLAILGLAVRSNGWADSESRELVLEIPFRKPIACQDVAVGLRGVIFPPLSSPEVRFTASCIKKSSAAFEVRYHSSIGNTKSEGEYMPLPPGDPIFQTVDADSKTDGWRGHKTFRTAFKVPPKVICWINGFEFGPDGDYNAEVNIKNITNTDFDYEMISFGDGKWLWGSAAFIAYPSNVSNVACGSVEPPGPFPQEGMKDVVVPYSRPFKDRAPRLLVGFSQIRSSRAAKSLSFMVQCERSGPAEATFTFTVGTGLIKIRAEYIALAETKLP